MEIFYKHRYLGSTLTLTWMFTTYYSYDYTIRAPPTEKVNSSLFVHFTLHYMLLF
ncbi:hypothetical protein LSH36_915g00102 [Paralvinella palmiformis]|uniref:Uncharacterized protein n=1 Tax=Paralvinella palmiformis TaxID=53620 RepID=A0AAD9MSQ8_9ANNE|nr:hypothetical protein LSH36_915g00102 [Paralvinella palmiformis]